VAVTERAGGGAGHVALRLAVVTAAMLGGVGALPGDIGGCGQGGDALEARQFFARKRAIECQRCAACGLESEACEGACEAESATTESFPEGCVPLVHDGEVCLRALESARCRSFATFVADQAPRMPTECDFCPPSAAP
jgi:hypothetical protein